LKIKEKIKLEKIKVENKSGKLEKKK